LCKRCPDGTYTPAENYSRVCLNCPPGHFSLTESKECTRCPRGTISKKWGSPKCDPCELGTYAKNRGQSLCKKCPPNKTTYKFGTIFEEDCE